MERKVLWRGFCWICLLDSELPLRHPPHNARVRAAGPKWPRCPDKIHRSPESSLASCVRGLCLQSPQLFAVLPVTSLTSFVLAVPAAHIHTRSQVPVQPVTAAGPEHSKPLEKTESLFNQERDPRFSEIYSSINTGEECGAVRHAQGHVASLSHLSFNPSALCSFPSHPEQFWVWRLSVTVVWQPRSCRMVLILMPGG